MLSTNEWDPLEHVIIGDATGARIPNMDTSLRVINYSHVNDVSDIPVGLYPRQVIDEANQDLQSLCDFLASLDIKVDRPHPAPSPGYYNYCPRDNTFVFGDIVLETPMPLRARRGESHNLRHVFQNLDDDFRWITINARNNDALYNLDSIGNPDVLALLETEAAFDAANIIRANDDVFYLVSNSGNHRGAELLQSLLPNQRVWPIQNLYSYMHIDSTITLLREGLMLLNPERVTSIDLLPPPLQSWDVIWCPDPGPVLHHPGYCNSSRWVAMNLLSVSPDLVLVESQQTELARVLNRHGIDTQLMPMRHCRTLGGSFHCVSLDIKRKIT
jgi:glycine amidinotransferase/scyllo-inosamine-4-phosphate amidinotransferase 1